MMVNYSRFDMAPVPFVNPTNPTTRPLLCLQAGFSHSKADVQSRGTRD